MDVITVTGKSSKAIIVLLSATVLYVTNLIENLVQWQDIAYLIGTSGASREESLLSATAAFAINAALDDATKLLPFVVANGLLVRYLHACDNISII